MEEKKIHIILNPVAGGGKAGRLMSKLLPEIKRNFGSDYALHVTRKPFDATHIARRAADAGAQLIIAAGGDGTVQETVNGLFTGCIPVNPFCALGILNYGTGKGLAQTLNLPSSHQDQLDLIINSSSSQIDVGYISYENSQGKRCERIFVSECQLGIGSAVAKQVHSAFKRLGGKIAFGMVAVLQSIRYKANHVRLQYDDEAPITEELIGLVIGNGRYCAGGMKLTPSARPDDGYFDTLCIHDMSIPIRMLNFSKIYSGNHIYSKYFTIRQNKRLRINSEEALTIEADGELLGTVPCHIELLPSFLKIKYKSNGNHT